MGERVKSSSFSFLLPLLSLLMEFGFIFQLTVYVPGATSAGTKSATVTLTPSGGGAITLPISLYVFNFVLDQ